MLKGVLNEINVDAEVCDITRLGGESEGKTRPLKFTVKEMQMKKEILAEAKKLKEKENETVSKIFVCPDRTPKQREINRKMVARIKKKERSWGECYYSKRCVEIFSAKRLKGRQK